MNRKKELSIEEIENRFAEIDAQPHEAPTPEDLAAFAESEAEREEDAVSLDEYIAQKEFSGKLMLRIPKDLHRELARAAKENGVSLNQYAMYKLAK